MTTECAGGQVFGSRQSSEAARAAVGGRLLMARLCSMLAIVGGARSVRSTGPVAHSFAATMPHRPQPAPSSSTSRPRSFSRISSSQCERTIEAAQSCSPVLSSSGDAPSTREASSDPRCASSRKWTDGLPRTNSNACVSSASTSAMPPSPSPSPSSSPSAPSPAGSSFSADGCCSTSSTRRASFLANASEDTERPKPFWARTSMS